MRSYLFLTDPTYANTHLVVVHKRGADAVNVDCVGPVSTFAPINQEWEVAKVDLVKDTQSVGACTNGVHRASSRDAFGLTVWGWDTWVSYAYPAGTFVRRINTFDPTPR
jgi:hypothetical protein